MFALAVLLGLASAKVHQLNATEVKHYEFHAGAGDETTIIIQNQGGDYRTFVFTSAKVTFEVDIDGRTRTKEQSLGLCVTTDHPIITFKAEVDVVVLIIPYSRCSHGAYTYTGAGTIKLERPYSSISAGEVTSYCIFAPSMFSQNTEVEAEIDYMYGQTNVYIHTPDNTYGSGAQAEFKGTMGSFYTEFKNEGAGSDLEYKVEWKLGNNFTTSCMQQAVDYVPLLIYSSPLDMKRGVDKCYSVGLDEDAMDAAIVIAVVVVLLLIFTPLLMICCGCGVCCATMTKCPCYGCLRGGKKVVYGENAPFQESLMSDGYPGQPSYQPPTTQLQPQPRQNVLL